MTTRMKLYTHPLSPACRNVIVSAACLGIPLDTHVVNAQAGEHRTPEYAKLNPNALFPVLQDGDFVLWESNAITQYLASMEPGNTLLPRDERTRADIARWQFWEQAHWSPACRPYLWENFFKPLLGQGESSQDELQKAAEKLDRCSRVLDSHLADCRWLVGDNLTLADIAVASPLMYLQQARLPLDHCANIRGWLGRIESLPAWRDSAPDVQERLRA